MVKYVPFTKEGWHGRYYDAVVGHEGVNVTKAVLTESNIADFFRKDRVPVESDYVSIDVDSVDVWLLMGIFKGGFMPRVFSIEYNGNYGTTMITYERQWSPWDGYSSYGSSAGAIELVAKMYGYTLVSIFPGLDMFYFVIMYCRVCVTCPQSQALNPLRRSYLFNWQRRGSKKESAA